MDDIYTIGYSVFTIDEFINVIKKYGINGVIDVRSNPSSAHFPDYNKTELSKRLEEVNIIYRNFKDEFGARQIENRYYPNGYLDFDLFCESNQFVTGIKRLKTAYKMNYKLVLMCAEKDPINCHRCIMIGNKIRKYFTVNHITSDKEIQTQDDIDLILLNKYYPNRNQLTIYTFTSRIETNDEELIKKAYKSRNAAIGYKIEEEDYE